MNIELLPAKKYYGKHATGHVVLNDGHAVYHGDSQTAREVHSRLNVQSITDTLSRSNISADTHSKHCRAINEPGAMPTTKRNKTG